MGWGWFAAWFDPSFHEHVPALIAYDAWSHSGYFDVLLGGGIVGLLLAGTLVAGFANAGALARSMGCRAPACPSR